jgi:hypothetical protein
MVLGEGEAYYPRSPRDYGGSCRIRALDEKGQKPGVVVALTDQVPAVVAPEMGRGGVDVDRDDGIERCNAMRCR